MQVNRRRYIESQIKVIDFADEPAWANATTKFFAAPLGTEIVHLTMKVLDPLDAGCNAEIMYETNSVIAPTAVTSVKQVKAPLDWTIDSPRDNTLCLTVGATTKGKMQINVVYVLPAETKADY